MKILDSIRRTILRVRTGVIVIACAQALQVTAQDNFREQYLLRADDKLSLKVFDEPDLTTTVSVSRTGHIALPLINNVKVGGLTIPEATKLVREVYAADYIKNPVVTLGMEEYAAELVTVIGQVASPGDIPLPQSGEIDVASALATAGGVTEFADPENIKLTMVNGGNLRLSLEDLKGNSGSIKMRAGDKLVVLETPNAHAKVWVAGEVSRPGPLPLPKIGRMDVASALAGAGGPSALANLGAIKIIPATGNPFSLTYDSIQNARAGRVFLKNGDRVLVTQSPYANTSVTVLGQVASPGRLSFPLNKPFDLMEAIAEAGGFTRIANLKNVTVTRNGRAMIIDVRDYGKTANNPRILLQPNDIITVRERLF